MKTKFYKILSRLFPSLFCFLVNKGIIEEPEWVNLKLDKRGSLDYLQDFHRNREWYCDFVSSLKNPHVLEIGAGAMFEVKKLSEKNFLDRCSYNIVDLSREVLKRGSQLFPQVNFKKGNINNLPFEDNTFDVTYCRGVVEHQPDFKLPIQEIWRVTKGVAIIFLFRWTLGENIFSRVKKISNSYNVHEVCGYCQSLGANLKTFILLKGAEPGENRYESHEEIRSGDYLVLFLEKGNNQYSQNLEASLNAYREFLIEEPYSVNPPRYTPKFKQVLKT